MTWFDLIKSSEMKEFELLAEKYAGKGDMLHLDYLRKKHGKRSNEFYDALNDQIVKYLKEEDRWCSLQDISKSIQEQNPGLKDKEENLESFLRKKLEGLEITTKQEPGVGRTGRKTYYKV